jgi:hypothetical protein
VRAGAAAMLPPFEFAGGLVTEPFAFEKEISSDESLTLSDVRALSSKRRTLCAFRGVASDPQDAEARSAAADEYVPHLEALVARIEQIDVTADRQKRFGFVWNSPLEGLGNTFKLTDINHELGMAWMARAAAKRHEAVVAVDERPRAVVGPARHERDDERLVVIGGSVLETPPPGTTKNSSLGSSPAAPGSGLPASPGFVLGEVRAGDCHKAARRGGHVQALLYNGSAASQEVPAWRAPERAARVHGGHHAAGVPGRGASRDGASRRGARRGERPYSSNCTSARTICTRARTSV